MFNFSPYIFKNWKNHRSYKIKKNFLIFIFWFRITKNERCHPLLSRKRALSRVISSPSYIPPKKKIPKPRESIFCRKTLKIEQTANKKTFPVIQRRKTININELKQSSSRNLDNKSRRKTVHICQPNKENSKAMGKVDKNYTPWRNKALSMR